jgi:hypothetical protein
VFLIAALSLGAVYGLWTSHERTVAERGLLPFQDTNGFVPVQTPPGTPPDQVIILAALNCPSAAAQRADTMAKRLTEMGIPNTRANHYSASITDRGQFPLLQRTSPVLTPPLSMRCSVPRIDWMSGSAAHLKPMTRSRARMGATSPRTACFGPN